MKKEEQYRGLYEGTQPASPNTIENDYQNALIYQERTRPENNIWETLKDAYLLEKDSTAMKSIERASKMKELETQGPKISPTELNQMFPGMEVPFGEPTSLAVAQYLSDYQYQRNLRKIRISDGDKGGLGWAARFGAGMAAHMTDPLELAANIVLGKGVNWLAESYSLTRPLALAPAGSFARFNVSLAENIVSQAAIEPILYAQTRRDQLEYTASDAFMSIAGGAVGGSLLEMGVGRISNYLRRNKVAGTTLTTQKALGDALEGVEPRVEPLLNYDTEVKNKLPDLPVKRNRVFYDEALGRSFNWDAPYEYKKISSVAGTKKAFFTTPDSGMGGLGGTTYGNGYYFTDNYGVAEVYGLDVSGKSEVVSIVPKKSLKLLDLDTPLTPKFSRAVKDAVLKNVPDDFIMVGKNKKDSDAAFKTIVEEILETSSTKKEALDEIRNLVETNNLKSSVFEEIRKPFKSYDGYLYTRVDDLGQSNGVLLFKTKGNIDPVFRETIKYDVDSPLDSPSVAEALGTPTREQRIFHDPIDESEFLDTPPGIPDIPGDEVSGSAFMKERREIESQIKILEDPDVKDFMGQETLDLIEEAKMGLKELELDEKLIKASYFCTKGEV